jgi:hypothetical protein
MSVRCEPAETEPLIAGKGHEKYQAVAGERRSLDDVAVAREALSACAHRRNAFRHSATERLL